jgi:magnesium and cobalt transporter|tara:strand:- start:58 stop:963 length:906 start_codon:yes stop_codon:yes gene_type:complete
MLNMSEISRQIDDKGKEAEALPHRILATFLRLLGARRNEESTVREHIEELIEDVDGSTTQIGEDEGKLIVNVLKLHELTAEDVMVPRTDIVAVDISSNLEVLINIMVKNAHSRIPVYDEQLDNIAGFVHIKDVLSSLRNRRRESVRDLTREILFAAPSVRVLDLLLEMRDRRTHIAIVVDEFGGVDGLITIEDLVEEIVGEIEDEHDTQGPTIVIREDGSILADARSEIEELEKVTGKFASDEERKEIDTIGGIVFSLVDRVPRRREIITHPSGLEFEIVDADSRRLKMLSVRNLQNKVED